MRRRQFIALVGGAAAGCSLAAHAQQPATPLIGILATAPVEANAACLRAFYTGLQELGFVDGQNVKVEYRWIEKGIGQLPETAAQSQASARSSPRLWLPRLATGSHFHRDAT